MLENQDKYQLENMNEYDLHDLAYKYEYGHGVEKNINTALKYNKNHSMSLHNSSKNEQKRKVPNFDP